MERRWGIGGFDWDDANEDHIARHGVTPPETEEVFRGRVYVKRSRGGRYFVLGRSGAGRYLALAVERYEGNVVRVLMARDMSQWERKLFLSRRK
jgi:uncharacterized DUF497 family protein